MPIFSDLRTTELGRGTVVATSVAVRWRMTSPVTADALVAKGCNLYKRA